MKIRFTCFIGIIASVLCLCEANAKTKTCPAGCFCLNNGTYESNSNFSTSMCEEHSAFYVSSPERCFSDGALWYNHPSVQYIACTDTAKQTYGNLVSHLFNEFSELYYGNLGAYGYINNEIVYLPRDTETAKTVYNCPETYPLSEAGAKSLYECFTYDDKGNKVYYKKSSGKYSSTDSGNINIAKIRALAESLQQSLDQTNKIAYELQKALEEPSQKQNYFANIKAGMEKEAKLLGVVNNVKNQELQTAQQMQSDTSAAKAMIDAGITKPVVETNTNSDKKETNIKTVNEKIEAVKATIGSGITPAMRKVRK